MNTRTTRLSLVTACGLTLCIGLVAANETVAQARDRSTASDTVRFTVKDQAVEADVRESAAARSSTAITAAARPAAAETAAAQPDGSAPVATAAVPSSPTVTLSRPPISAYVFDASRAPRAVNLEDQAVDLKRGELLVMQTTGITKQATPVQIKEAGTIRLELPIRAYYVNSAGVVKKSGLVAEIAGGGLRMREDGRGFLGQIFVALVDMKDGTATYAFDNPASLLVTASVENVEPQQFSLPGTNDWKRVKLSASNPDDPVPLRIRASITPDGLDIKVPVIRPIFTVSGDPEVVQGLGLQEMTITVASVGLPNPEGRSVILASTRGKLGETRVRLESDGVATTTLRSIGAGPVTVTARSEGFADTDSEGLKFSWPFVFVLAALIGGIVGSAIRHFQKTRRSGRSGILRLLTTGALSGLAAAVLYAVGVNILPINPTATAGEALVFALALVGGFMGFRLPQAG
jgi:hypothetical protein